MLSGFQNCAPMIQTPRSTPNAANIRFDVSVGGRGTRCSVPALRSLGASGTPGAASEPTSGPANHWADRGSAIVAIAMTHTNTTNTVQLHEKARVASTVIVPMATKRTSLSSTSLMSAGTSARRTRSGLRRRRRALHVPASNATGATSTTVSMQLSGTASALFVRGVHRRQGPAEGEEDDPAGGHDRVRDPAQNHPTREPERRSTRVSTMPNP